MQQRYHYSTRSCLVIQRMILKRQTWHLIKSGNWGMSRERRNKLVLKQLKSKRKLKNTWKKSLKMTSRCLKGLKRSTQVPIRLCQTMQRRNARKESKQSCLFSQRCSTDLVKLRKLAQSLLFNSPNPTRSFYFASQQGKVRVGSYVQLQLCSRDN